MRIAQNSNGDLTRKKLAEATGCQGYLIAYYTSCGYLPVNKPSTGPGDPILYAPGAVNAVLERMQRQQYAQEEPT